MATTTAKPTGLYPAASAWFNSDIPEYFPGPTIAGFNPYQTQAFGQMQQGAENIRRGTADQYNWFNQQMQQDPSKNPYADLIAKDFTNAMNQQFSEQQLPALRGAQIAAGNVGGSAAGIQTGMAARDLNTTIGRGVNDIYFNAWNNAAQRQQNMMQMIPQMSELAMRGQMMPGEIGVKIGALNQAQAQMELDAERDRWNYYRDAPERRMGVYSNIVQGQPYTTTTQSGSKTIPGQGANWADILAGGAMFASPYMSSWFNKTPAAAAGG
jgi:hypothetical protein